MVSHSSVGYIRKLATSLIAVAVVNWTLIFRQTYDDTPTETKREMRFEDEKQGRVFYDHRPTGLFECVNSLTAMPGYCEVKDVRITEEKRGK